MENGNKDLKKGIIWIVVALIGYWIINNLNTVGNILGIIFTILFPFVLGGCLAFLLNIPMTFFERKLSNLHKNKKKNTKLLRTLSIIFAIVIILCVLALVVTLIVPELVEIVSLFINNIPYYAEQITKIAQEQKIEIPDINSMIQDANIDMELIKKQITNMIPSLLTSSISVVSSIVSGISSFVIAVIFAIYILIDKEKLQNQATKMLYAYCKKEKADKLIYTGKVTKETFKNFFTVQCLETTIHRAS